MKNSSLLGAVCAYVFVSSVFTIADAAEPVLTNGSLTGTPIANEVPPGWTIPIPTASPSTVGENGPFNFTDVPWTLSPDGGTFVRGNGHVDVEFQDAFEQSVSGFAPGESYTLEFFQTNLGFRDVGHNWDDWLERDGYWGLFVNDTLVGQSTTISGPANFDDPILWLSDGITFTASSAAQTLRLQAFTAESEIAYLGIDGLTLTLGGTTTPAPEFDSTPAAGTTLAFGEVEQTESAELVVQVYNIGNANLTLGCSVTGSDSGSFNLKACPAPIAGDGSGNISVSCQPESIGAKTAVLEVATNDTDEANVTYNLTCTGTKLPAPEFDSTPVAGATLAFGEQAEHIESSNLIVQVDNIGNADLILGCSVTGSDIGSFNLKACPTPIVGPGSGNISVSCQPESIGVKAAALEVTTNDADEPKVSYNLTCEGLPTDILFLDGFED